ncbi:MAG: CRISPR-associated ring nuclease Csm6 [Verrucomicrobiales bacterium]|nr:CRISPR-associated ring nuclease Csm6 [Verrucomicrobiales bacterium]
MKASPQSAIRSPQSEIVLLAVTGMSPAVLTETVWALANPEDHKFSPIIPVRIVALTTTAGQDAVREQLFGRDRIWERLRQDVLGASHANNSRLYFGPEAECVRVFTRNVGGKPVVLRDVSSEAENIAVADFITDQLWGFVEKPDTRLIASISGGFKTMSALLFAGMSLLGRKDDLITHVLVDTPYDTKLDPLFFFPRQPRQELKDARGKVWLAGKARLRLGLVPFVPLNDLLEKYKKPRSYSDLVERCRGNLQRHVKQAVVLRLSVHDRRVMVNDTCNFRLGAQPFLFLLFLAERAKKSEPRLGKYFEAMEPYETFVREFQKSWQQRGADWAAPGKKVLPEGFSQCRENYDDGPVRTKLLYGITEKIREMPGAALLEAYLPEPGRCTLDLPPEKVLIQP